MQLQEFPIAQWHANISKGSRNEWNNEPELENETENDIYTINFKLIEYNENTWHWFHSLINFSVAFPRLFFSFHKTPSDSYAVWCFEMPFWNLIESLPTNIWILFSDWQREWFESFLNRYRISEVHSQEFEQMISIDEKWMGVFLILHRLTN